MPVSLGSNYQHFQKQIQPTQVITNKQLVVIFKKYQSETHSRFFNGKNEFSDQREKFVSILNKCLAAHGKISRPLRTVNVIGAYIEVADARAFFVC